MSETKTVAQSLRALGITAERIADTIAGRVDDAGIRITVRLAVAEELFWLERLIAESEKPPTLTDAEQDDLRVWLAECLRQASTATEGANEELAERWRERAKRAAAMLERMGGER